MLRKLLVACGAISSLLYLSADLAAALIYPDYHSFTAQAISELTAIGAPTRALVQPLFIAYDVLIAAFAAGLWMSVRDDRLRVTAAFVAGIGLAGLVAAPFADMNQRGAAFAPNDMLHIAVTTVLVLCIFGAVMFAAAAFGRSFFKYSIGTLVVLAIFGVMAGLQGARLAAGEPTPWLGIVERIHIGAYLLWVGILSLAVWPGAPTHDVPSRGGFMRRLIVTLTALGLLAAGTAAFGQEGPYVGAGRFEFSGFPMGGIFFTGSSDQQEPAFGAYAMGASLTLNLNHVIGFEGEFGNAGGVRQDMTFQERALIDQRAPSLYAYTGNVVVHPMGNKRFVVPYATGGVGGITLVDSQETVGIGVTRKATYFAGNVGGGVKWFAHRYFGLRGDYRLVMVQDKVTAPAFFGRNEVRYGHRLYGGLMFTY